MSDIPDECYECYYKDDVISDLKVQIYALEDAIERALAVPANWGNEVYEIEDILKKAIS